VGDRPGRTAYHQAIASLETPHATTRADIEVVQALSFELFRTPDVIDVIRVPTVNENVSGGKLGGQFPEQGIHSACRNHDPDGARPLEHPDELVQRFRALRTLIHECLHVGRISVEHGAIMATPEQPSNHVRSHPSQSDHSELHDPVSCLPSTISGLASFVYTPARSAFA
jgi:hypothetical protein